MESLLQWDYNLFYIIHVKAANSFCDFLFPFLRNAYFWAPLYLFLSAFMLQKYGKRGLFWCLWLVVTFGIADFVSASLLKPMFMRTRPCMDPMWYDVLRKLVNASTGPGFPSTHASNHFAMSTFIVISLDKLWPKAWMWAYLWAVLVAWAQVYVGVHYPTDVMAGALLGIWIGYITGNYFNLRHDL